MRYSIDLLIVKETSHFKQLDAFRALAVLLVICSHWLPKEYLLNQFFPLGFMGVTSFFVISGFLITNILLKDEGRTNPLRQLRAFYLKRFLRIFPPYYLVIIIGALFSIESIIFYWKWHVLYLTNFLVFIKQDWIGSASHFWSLAVEEQFYIFWPIVIIFLKRSLLYPVIFLFVLLGPIFRSVIFFLAENDFVSVVTPGAIDSLAIGGLAAYIVRHYRFIDRNYYHLIVFGSMLIFISVLLVRYFYGFNNQFVIVFMGLSYSIMNLGILYRFCVSDLPPMIFSNPFLLFIGKTSYMIYLAHNFTYPIINSSFELSPSISFIVSLAVLILFSSMSWFAFERPILSLKKYIKL